MIALMIVMGDEVVDLGFEITRQVIVFQEDSALEGLVPALYFALRLRMIGPAADMAHTVILHPCGQVMGDVRSAIVGKQTGFVSDLGVMTARGLQGKLQCLRHIIGCHRGAQFPSYDVTREVIQDGRQIKPAPANDLEIGEIGLP